MNRYYSQKIIDQANNMVKAFSEDNKAFSKENRSFSEHNKHSQNITNHS